MSTPYKKRFPNPKIPVTSAKVGGLHLLLTFSPSSGGSLICSGHSPATDASYATLPIVPSSWRSFGLGAYAKLKPKHRKILHDRIVKGLDVVGGELMLTWVWVVEEREAREKKEGEER